MSITKFADELAEFKTHIKALDRSRVPVWNMEKLSEFVAFAIGKLSPLQFGDTAELIDSINPLPDSGWYCHRHVLVAGKRGWIREVDWRDGVWRYLWEPENQTWISSLDGSENPVSRPYHYQMTERELRLVDRGGKADG